MESLTTKELAGLWGMTSRNITRLRGLGMPFTDVGLGGRVVARYDADACRDWLRCRSEARAEAQDRRQKDKECSTWRDSAGDEEGD